MEQTIPHLPSVRGESKLYMSFELSDRTWLLSMSNGSTDRRRVEVKANMLERLKQEIASGKKHFDLSEEAEVLSCYEAGRYGFWIHRFLETIGVKNVIVDASSIEVPRKKKRKKTDRLDGESLLRLLMRYYLLDRQAFSVLRIPSTDAEDLRREHRTLERMKKERGMHRVRIMSLLKLHGVSIRPISKDFLKRLDAVRLWDGSKLGAYLKLELQAEYERLVLVKRQIKEIEQARKKRLSACREAREEEKESRTTTRDAPKEEDRWVEKVVALRRLRGLNDAAWILVGEFFGWRKFSNRRELGAAAGLTGTPFNSGNDEQEAGISKEGSARVRSLMIELSWAWLRYQPSSKLSHWFQERYGEATKRHRRVGIVAVARRLLIDLWRYVEKGTRAEGMELK